MTDALTADAFVTQLERYRSAEELQKIQRYFKSGAGEYGAGDRFLGVKMGQVFALAKAFIALPLAEIERLLDNPLHEVRAGAVSIMEKQARRKTTPETHRKALYELYLRRIDRINNWDLVDLGAPYVVGGYLADKPRDILYVLARSANVWERRTAIVATAAFLKAGEVEDTFAIAVVLRHDAHDLIQKAVGGWLRAAGKHNQPQLLRFLDAHAATMPRTMLRYAIEHVDQEQRAHYLALKAKDAAPATHEL
jgi:3-methyladenine DNA glycosylase AlkD